MPHILVYMTAPTEAEAAAIGRALVEEGLAACVNILGPIRSIHRWQGKLEDGAEIAFLAKTRAELFDGLDRRVRELHSYEVPAILAIKVEAGSAPFLDWISQMTAAH